MNNDLEEYKKKKFQRERRLVVSDLRLEIKDSSPAAATYAQWSALCCNRPANV